MPNKSLDEKVMSREAVSVMVLFDNLSNNFNSIGGVDFMEILCFSTNVESMKWCIDLEFMRA